MAIAYPVRIESSVRSQSARVDPRTTIPLSLESAVLFACFGTTAIGGRHRHSFVTAMPKLSPACG
jgi:hypothetical protein